MKEGKPVDLCRVRIKIEPGLEQPIAPEAAAPQDPSAAAAPQDPTAAGAGPSTPGLGFIKQTKAIAARARNPSNADQGSPLKRPCLVPAAEPSGSPGSEVVAKINQLLVSRSLHQDFNTAEPLLSTVQRAVDGGNVEATAPNGGVVADGADN